MSEEIISALIMGTATIIGAIIGKFSRKSNNNYSRVKLPQNHNNATNSNLQHRENEKTKYSIAVRKRRNQNTNTIKFTILFVVTIIIIDLGPELYNLIQKQLLFNIESKNLEIESLNSEIESLNKKIDQLNKKLLSYKEQDNSSEFTDLKMRLSRDAIYTINLLKESGLSDQQSLLYLYNTFIRLLDELVNENDIDLNRLLEDIEQAEETLKRYGVNQ